MTSRKIEAFDSSPDLEDDPTAKSKSVFSVWKMTRLLTVSSLPSLIQSLTSTIAFSMMIYFISLHKESNLVGAVGMGTTIYFTGITAFLQALNVGLAILGSQAFGAKNPQLLGYYFKKSLVIQMAVLVPLALMCSRFSKIFKMIGFQPDLAEDIEKVVLAMIPSAIPFFYFDTAKNFLVAQKIFAIQGYVQLITSVIDVPVQYTLIVYFDLQIVGLGLCRFIMESVRALCLYIYIKKSGKCEESIVPWDSNCFKGLWTLFKFQFAAGSLQIIDLIGTQVILLQAGYFTKEEVTGNVIVTRVTKFFIIWTISIGVALSSFVGNSMGEQNEAKARAFIKTGLGMDCFLICVMWLIIGSQRYNIVHIFTDDDTVTKNAVGLLMFYMILLPFDNLQNVLGGILRSVGKEKQSSRLYMLTYYPIAIPLSFLLAHWAGFRLYGLYGSMLVARSMNVIGSIYLLSKADLKDQIRQIVSRVEKNKAEVALNSPSRLDEVTLKSDADADDELAV